MLVFGEIVSTKGHLAKVKLYDCEEFETDWMHIPQMCTVKDKSFSNYEIGTEVALILGENGDDGCIIGALYNDEDVSVSENNNIKTIVFSDGTNISYDKENHVFLLDIKGDATIKSERGLTLDCDVKITKTLEVEKDVKVSKSIVAEEDITDKGGSMQDIRDTYNSHGHPANGAPPTAQMGS